MQANNALRDLPPRHVLRSSIETSQKGLHNSNAMYAKQNASLETLWLTWKSFPLPGRDICIRSAIFANHHIKYDVNKLCAQSLASLTNTGITYCAAKDHPILDALRARPDLPTKKLEWLKRRRSRKWRPLRSITAYERHACGNDVSY